MIISQFLTLILLPYSYIFEIKTTLFAFPMTKLSLNQNLSKFVQWFLHESVTNKEKHFHGYITKNTSLQVEKIGYVISLCVGKPIWIHFSHLTFNQYLDVCLT